jgi:hypothetical protein
MPPLTTRAALVMNTPTRLLILVHPCNTKSKIYDNPQKEEARSGSNFNT